MVLIAAAAETQSTGTEATEACRTAECQRVVRGDDGINLEITARGTVTPQAEHAGAIRRASWSTCRIRWRRDVSGPHLSVGSDGVKDVRVGMDGQTPPTTRLVVDLEQACRYELVPGSDNKIVLKTLHRRDGCQGSPPSRAVTVTATEDHRRRQGAAAAVVRRPVALSRRPSSRQANARPLAQHCRASAQHFVFVEPSYKPKDAS